MEKINISQIKENFHKFANLKWRNSENFEYYILDRDYIEKLEPFFDEIDKNIDNKEIFFRNSLNENLASFDRGGFFIGVFNGVEIAAVIGLDVSYGENSLPNFMNISKEDRYNSIIFDTICVLPKYRGYNLQEKMMCVCEYICLQRKYKYAFMSISPNNYYSLHNAFKKDFTIFTIENLYGSDDKNPLVRYILSKPLGKILAPVKEQYSVLNSNIDMQKEVISLGFVGMKAINFVSENNFFVSYSKAFYD